LKISTINWEKKLNKNNCSKKSIGEILQIKKEKMKCGSKQKENRQN